MSTSRSLSRASRRASSWSRSVCTKSTPSAVSGSMISSPESSEPSECRAFAKASRFSGIFGVLGESRSRIHSARSVCTTLRCSCRSPICTPGKIYSFAARRRRERCILLMSIRFSRRHEPDAVAAIRSVTGRSYTSARKRLRVSRMRIRIASCASQSAIVRARRRCRSAFMAFIASRRERSEERRVMTRA